MDQPAVYSPKPSPSRLILISIFLAGIILSFFAGYFFPKVNNLTILDKPHVDDLSNTTVNPPIAVNSSAVKSLWMVYLLTGVIERVTPMNKDGENGYEIRILSPAGYLINRKFFMSSKAANVVLLDKQVNETKYQLSSLKKGDPVQLNFQMDVKNTSVAQITKIMVLK